jgi:hypothetical protein
MAASVAHLSDLGWERLDLVPYAKGLFAILPEYLENEPDHVMEKPYAEGSS